MGNLHVLVNSLTSPRILVLGDVILDRYSSGDAERVSPEAPVLVLRVDHQEVRLGGAASVASMLRALGAEVSLAGVVGDDGGASVGVYVLQSSNGVPQPPSAGLLRAQTIYAYDEVGQLYGMQVCAVDPTTGVVRTYVDSTTGKITPYALTTNTFYDLRGEVIAQYNPGGLVNKTQYDTVGRAIVSYATDGAGGMTWSAANSVAADNVLQQIETTYDNDGNSILVTTRQRFDNEVQLGPLFDPNNTGPKARVYYVASYYDAANRPIATVNVGTNGGTAWTRAATVPGPSNTVLVTSQTYNLAGWQAVTTDPRGIMRATFYDNLGRVTRTIQAYFPDNATPENPTPDDPTPTDSNNQSTDFGYDGDGNRLFVRVDLPNGEVEKTLSVYGVNPGNGSVVTSNDMLFRVLYPDPTSGQPSSDPDLHQQVGYTLNALGQITTMTDRNGTTHSYIYDVLGRQSSDIITRYDPVFGASVDKTVQRIDIAYDTQGNAFKFTSYASTAGIGVLNQVVRTFNDLDQLIQEYQSNFGAANDLGLIPSVGYTYLDLASGADNSRLGSIQYPNGRTVSYVYQSGIDNAISRVSLINSNMSYTNPDTLDVLERLSYLGLGTVVGRSFPQIQVALSYVKQQGEPLGDGGDQYTGLDRFGRIVDQNWFPMSNSAVPVSRIQYAYDPDSNMLYAKNLVNSAFSELYHRSGPPNQPQPNGQTLLGYFNGFNQLGYFDRGTLLASTNTQLDTIANSSDEPAWVMDSLGNLLTSSRSDNNGNPETFTYNKQNQITSVSGGTTPQYDKNGNMVRDESNTVQAFDAWNRLVRIQTVSETNAYTYDALGRRITQTTTAGSLVAMTNFYFNQNRQVIEERTGGSLTSNVSAQYVWSPAGSNLMTERDDEFDAQGNWNTRVYALQDPLGSVTTLYRAVTSAGVVERYIYDPFGAVQILTANWTRGRGAYNWQYFFQAGRYNTTTGQYSFDRRDYNPEEGRWSEMDPLGFGGGDVNQYRFEASNPLVNTDTTGCISSWIGAGLGALAGLGTYAVTSLVTGQDMSWGGAGSAALNGAMAGAVGAAVLTGDVSGAFVLGLATGAVGGAAGSALQQGIDNGWSNVNMDQVYVGALSGALGGGLGALAGGIIGAGINRAVGSNIVSCGMSSAATFGGGALGGLAVDSAMQSINILAGVQSGWNWSQSVGSGLSAGLTASLMRACFAAGTPLLWEYGSKPIEQFKIGDRVWARDELDADGPLDLKAVEETFVRSANVLHLHVGGQIIRTTSEHPFYVLGKEWTNAGALVIGDLLSTHDGQWVAVEDLLDTGEYETVYNLRVADFHTYFVGSEEWGFSVWAHNANCWNDFQKENKGVLADSSEASAIWKISKGHAYDKHIVKGNEFPGVNTQPEFAQVIADSVGRAGSSGSVRSLANNRTAFYDDSLAMVVIRDPAHIDGGTAFRPSGGRNYFDVVLK